MPRLNPAGPLGRRILALYLKHVKCDYCGGSHSWIV